MDIDKIREAAKLADELVGNVTTDYKASQWLGVMQACFYESQSDLMVRSLTGTPRQMEMSAFLSACGGDPAALKSQTPDVFKALAEAYNVELA